MSLPQVAVLAALQGLAEALPVSRSGHEVVARAWLEAGAADSVAFEGILHLGTAAALAVVARRRLGAALADGVRAVAQPSLFTTSPAARDAALVAVAALTSAITSGLLVPHVEVWSESATATGIGLCVSGAALASISQIPRGLRAGARGPTLVASALVGVAHGLAAFPGGSRVGAALTMLLWLGVPSSRAVDLAFMVTIPSLLVAFARAALARGALAPAFANGTVALGLMLAFLGAALGSELLRSLAERRRVAALALWIIPLGLATLAYARALALPT